MTRCSEPDGNIFIWETVTGCREYFLLNIKSLIVTHTQCPDDTESVVVLDRQGTRLVWLGCGKASITADADLIEYYDIR